MILLTSVVSRYKRFDSGHIFSYHPRDTDRGIIDAYSDGYGAPELGLSISAERGSLTTLEKGVCTWARCDCVLVSTMEAKIYDLFAMLARRVLSRLGKKTFVTMDVWSEKPITLTVPEADCSGQSRTSDSRI